MTRTDIVDANSITNCIKDCFIFAWAAETMHVIVSRKVRLRREREKVSVKLDGDDDYKRRKRKKNKEMYRNRLTPRMLFNST
jgi:hypothetical protein